MSVRMSLRLLTSKNKKGDWFHTSPILGTSYCCTRVITVEKQSTLLCSLDQFSRLRFEIRRLRLRFLSGWDFPMLTTLPVYVVRLCHLYSYYIPFRMRQHKQAPLHYSINLEGLIVLNLCNYQFTWYFVWCPHLLNITFFIPFCLCHRMEVCRNVYIPCGFIPHLVG